MVLMGRCSMAIVLPWVAGNRSATPSWWRGVAHFHSSPPHPNPFLGNNYREKNISPETNWARKSLFHMALALLLFHVAEVYFLHPGPWPHAAVWDWEGGAVDGELSTGIRSSCPTGLLLSQPHQLVATTLLAVAHKCPNTLTSNDNIWKLFSIMFSFILKLHFHTPFHAGRRRWEVVRN